MKGLLVLPDRVTLFAHIHQNESIYWYRLLFHFGAEKIGLFSGLKSECSRADRADEALAALPRIRLFLMEQIPRFEALEAEIDQPFLRERSVRNRSTEQLDILPELPLNQQRTTSIHSAEPADQVLRSAKGSEVKVKTAANPTVLTPPKENDNPLAHVFEKALTADNFQGGSKTMDGSDEAEDHADALDELTLDSIMRTGRDAESYVKSNAVIETQFHAEAEQPAPTAHQYREWFHSERAYRQNWCTLNDFVHADCLPLVAPDALTARESEQLKHKLTELLNQYTWRNRQKDGPEFDMDALVRWWTQKSASGYQEQRIYSSRRKLKRDIALLILVDGSLSTDSWVSNRRVLDEIRKATQMLGVALEDFSEKVGIASFSSESRHHCSFGWLKGFDEPWKTLHLRMGSLKPQGYTRMGAAIRHATNQLLLVPARRRALLVITDAKATDYDHYEGRHGNEDIRKAVQEMLNLDIRFSAVVFSQRVTPTMTELFGANRFHVLQNAWDMSNACLDRFIDILH